MCKLIIFCFCFFLQQGKYKLIRRNVCTVVVIDNISQILFQERAQNVKKILPCDDRLLCELKFIFMTTLHCLICELNQKRVEKKGLVINGCMIQHMLIFKPHCNDVAAKECACP